MADPQQVVQGPDGNKYKFPSGTTKDQAIAYFKKRGIGAKDTPSVLSEEGKHPNVSKALSYIPAVTATLTGLAASESGPGAVVAAGLGGMAGKALEGIAREGMGFDKGKSGQEKVQETLLEGGKQAAYELGGRAVSAVAGRGVAALRGVKPEVVGETIGGIKMPETMGQATGKTGGFSQTVEHYLSKTFLGGPLQGVKSAQQEATRDILSNLSKASTAAPGEMAQNWERATQETRILGDKLYSSFSEADAKTVAPVASQIIKDESLRLPGKTRDALAKIATDPHQEIAASLGYKTADQAKKALGDNVWNQLVSKEEQAGKAVKGTIGDAIAARSELRDLATNSTDRNLKRLYGTAWEKLDAAIDASLTPEQKAIKSEADKVWRRSYIQERIAKNLTRMENVQSPSAAPMVMTDSFVKMVNQLGHQPITREGGRVVSRASDLEILFSNPSDRKAMVDLASFLKTKYATMGGQAGISESIARIGVALEALSIPASAALGHPVAAATGTAHLASMYVLAKVMANPGGARMLAAYFKSTGSAATTLAFRIAGEALEQKDSTPNNSHANLTN